MMRVRRALVILGLAVGALLPSGAAKAITPCPPQGCYHTNNTIAESADLHGQGANAKGTILLECSEGQMTKLTLTFTQGAVTGTGSATVRCTGAREAYRVTIPAQGDRFAPGPASACATATMVHHDVHTEWCRAAPVTLG